MQIIIVAILLFGINVIPIIMRCWFHQSHSSDTSSDNDKTDNDETEIQPKIVWVSAIAVCLDIWMVDTLVGRALL